jgi:predicted ABC-type ATPase
VGEAHPALWPIARPDGIGKTTWARRHLLAVAGTERLVSPHEIARGYSPLTRTPKPPPPPRAAC